MGDPAPEPIEYIITATELAAFTGQTKESSDSSFDTIIAGTIQTITGYLGYEVEEDELTETYKILEERDFLRLNASIIGITSVTINGATLASSGYWQKGRNYLQLLVSLRKGTTVVVVYDGGIVKDSREWAAVKEVALLMAGCDSMQRNGAAEMTSYGVQGGGTTSFAPVADRNPRKYLKRLDAMVAR
jgi:hypothetical protein